jgi:hypothetical protein
MRRPAAVAERAVTTLLSPPGTHPGGVSAIFVIARSESDEAIQRLCLGGLDCFAFARNDEGVRHVGLPLIGINENAALMMAQVCGMLRAIFRRPGAH